MKLSEINTTVLYVATLPSTKKKVKFRPFIVKEERALLSAYESEDGAVMLATLVNVVKNCIVDAPKILTTFDVEYMFLQIRAKSVGEYSLLNFTCAECQQETPQNIDILKAVVSEGKIKPTIVLSDDLSVVMKYPSVDDILDIQGSSPESVTSRTITACIDKVVVGEEVLKVSEEPIEETVEFLNNLQGAQYKKLEAFMNDVPILALDASWECPHCKTKNETILKGIYSFF